MTSDISPLVRSWSGKMCYNFIVQTKSISSRFENITVQRPEHFPETNKANHSKHNLKKYIYICKFTCHFNNNIICMVCWGMHFKCVNLEEGFWRKGGLENSNFINSDYKITKSRYRNHHPISGQIKWSFGPSNNSWICPCVNDPQ